MRRIDYNFNGTRLPIPDDLIHHELLVVVDGIIKAPQLKDYRWGGDYLIDRNLIIFETRLEGVCVQLIPVTNAISAPTATHAKRSPYEPRGLKSLQ